MSDVFSDINSINYLFCFFLLKSCQLKCMHLACANRKTTINNNIEPTFIKTLSADVTNNSWLFFSLIKYSIFIFISGGMPCLRVCVWHEKVFRLLNRKCECMRCYVIRNNISNGQRCHLLRFCQHLQTESVYEL